MMKRLTSFGILLTILVSMAGCQHGSPSSEVEKDPAQDAEYKRTHRAEEYRRAQDSQVRQAGQ